MSGKTLRHPRRSYVRASCTLAAVLVAALPLLLAACEGALRQEPTPDESSWHDFGDSGEQYRFLTPPTASAGDSSLRARVALRSQTPMLAPSLREITVRSNEPVAGVRTLSVQWQDAAGELLWAYELEVGSILGGFALSERSASDWLRIELSEAYGQIEESYRTADGVVVARQSALHIESCPDSESGIGCIFLQEHPALAVAGENLTRLYAGLATLQSNQEGERLTQLLADPIFREELRRLASFEVGDRSPEMTTVCRWAERGLLKCRFFPLQNPLCHAAVGATLACWIAEISGE